MLIAGFQKSSFVDYPGQPAAVVFTPYCNFNCVYCHNDHILGKEAPLIPEETVFAHLEKRRGLLKAVVVSGGEPTLQQNLAEFIRRVRSLGYLVKLDTNGSKPMVLLELMKEGLLDYVAMDVKAPLDKYAAVTRSSVDTDALQKSVRLLKLGGVPYEFRMTFAPALTSEEAVEGAKLADGCQRFFLQQYRARRAGDPAPHPPSLVRETAARIRKAIGVCTVRGLGEEEAR